uniref:Putative 15.3 kDa basic salivary protein n=1 Tax=Culex tarsalis TaxID=7177 RepID=A0A1Q3EUS5_CULTA
MKVLLLLCLALVPVVPQKVKTGCVTLSHKNFGGYLTSGKKNNDKTRWVSTKEEGKEQWEITDVGGGLYTIMNKEFDEYLVASRDTNWAKNYHVFLWIPGNEGLSGHKWKITRQEQYSIIEAPGTKSCLMTGSDETVSAKPASRCDVAPFFKWRIASC